MLGELFCIAFFSPSNFCGNRGNRCKNVSLLQRTAHTDLLGGGLLPQGSFSNFITGTNMNAERPPIVAFLLTGADGARAIIQRW
jgi:hypothetical protein